MIISNCSLHRKWNRLCFSYDFDQNYGQVSFNGEVSELVKDPDTSPKMNGQMNYRFLLLTLLLAGTFDGHMITGAGATAELVVTVGRYHFDHNPFIGTLAGINLWDRYPLLPEPSSDDPV